MKIWKILGIGIAIALIIANNGVNGIAGKEKPFLSKNEIADFLASLGINEKTISTMNLSDVYLSDIPDNFWSWMNMSKDDSAKMVKDIIHQVTVNETGALEKLIELFYGKEKRPILNFGPETIEELKGKPRTTVYGKIPKLDTQEERWEWLDELKEIDRKIDKILIKQHGYPNGPMVICGVGEGYLLLSMYEKYKMDEDLLKKIYSKIDVIAKSIGITNVPVVIEKSSQLAMTCDAGEPINIALLKEEPNRKL